MFPSYISCRISRMSVGMRGAGVPPFTVSGAVSTRISSHRPTVRKLCSVFAPPSTINDCTFFSYKEVIRSAMFCRWSSTIRSGSRPLQWRTFSIGCSLSSVTRPTRMASLSALSLCDSIFVNGVEMERAWKQSSMKPLDVCAHFNIMYGRRRVL